MLAPWRLPPWVIMSERLESIFSTATAPQALPWVVEMLEPRLRSRPKE